MIDELSIVTSCGAKTYRVGDTMMNGEIIAKIGVVQLHFTGDPYDHYAGYNKAGEMLFSVNCLCPCDVTYNIKRNDTKN